jgi:hypothetical protein
VSDPPAGGVCTTAGDLDEDGFTNAQECAGLSSSNGAAFTYPSCIDYQGPREECLDPESKDLFIELIPLPGNTILPDDPLMYVNCEGPGCLGITTHLVGNGYSNLPTIPPTRDIFWNPGQQKALRVTESDKIVEQFGQNDDERSVPPLGKDNIIIYTHRIRNYVTAILTSDPAVTVSEADILNAVNTFIRHTIAHEIGHGVYLWIECSPRTEGCHQKPGRSEPYYHMEQSVKVQGTTVYTSTKFDDASIGQFLLH